MCLHDILFDQIYILLHFSHILDPPRGAGHTPRLIRPVPIFRPPSILTLYTRLGLGIWKKKKLFAKMSILEHFQDFWGPPGGQGAPLGWRNQSQFLGHPLFSHYIPRLGVGSEKEKSYWLNCQFWSIFGVFGLPRGGWEHPITPKFNPRSIWAIGYLLVKFGKNQIKNEGCRVLTWKCLWRAAAAWPGVNHSIRWIQ